jgi:hypothetical protein
VHFRNQGASGIEDSKAHQLGFSADRLRHTVCTENNGASSGHNIQLFNEDRAFRLEIFNDELVVNDFMTHIDGSPIQGESALDDFDGPIYAGAETTRLWFETVRWLLYEPAQLRPQRLSVLL